MHIDKNNVGPSWTIGPGNYTGGELWIYDGRIPHCVCKYEGTRISIVYALRAPATGPVRDALEAADATRRPIGPGHLVHHFDYACTRPF